MLEAVVKHASDDIVWSFLSLVSPQTLTDRTHLSLTGILTLPHLEMPGDTSWRVSVGRKCTYGRAAVSLESVSYLTLS